MGQYAIRTCTDCGIKKSADLMNKRTIEVAAYFKSRKSVTPLTLLGALFGSRKAGGAIESWLFTTSSRKGSAVRKKEVILCASCDFKPRNEPGAGFSGISKIILFPIWGPFWLIRIIFSTILKILKIPLKILKIVYKILDSSIKYIRKNGLDRKFLSFLRGSISSVYGVTISGGSKVMTSGKKKVFARSLKARPDNYILSEAFINSEFQEIANYILMITVASADGRFTKDEKLFIQSTIEISPKSAVLGDVILEREKLRNAFIGVIQKHSLSNEDFIQSLVKNLFSIAEIDEVVDEKELAIIEELAKDLGFPKNKYIKIKNETHEKVLRSGKKFATENLEMMISDSLKN